MVINPYIRYPIYTNTVVKMYIGKRRNEVPPHLFAISDGAYQQMMNGERELTFQLANHLLNNESPLSLFFLSLPYLLSYLSPSSLSHTHSLSPLSLLSLSSLSLFSLSFSSLSFPYNFRLEEPVHANHVRHFLL